MQIKRLPIGGTGIPAKTDHRGLHAEGGLEIARYDLSEDASTEAAMIFGEIYKRSDEWKFRAVGQGFAGGLAPLSRSYGVDVG
ncbi:MAG: TerD family protein [Magnetococcales bacterium]|nr:TerD family protein [Magnetococcales bacterium]